MQTLFEYKEKFAIYFFGGTSVTLSSGSDLNPFQNSINPHYQQYDQLLKSLFM